ncbi:LysR family transcriptional regulator [Sphingomonas sp. RP10(2022)]|uniref:LysR family transcriptional regulator n=1 Tax=Sphingomonas liriopis TaxID=2949094 RepID=A0A9X2HVL7_9SPHN|nr:LysR family transcriptional regulator [Sphingomonas liriopis]MCP3734961.1 LysR family transcriptional regulator [Sphingomonas liriopis]
MIDRYLLRYFLAVIDQGNFSKAAAACNVSQPTLSVGIVKLETALGRTLFNRTNRRVALTEAGVRLAEHARKIEVEFALAERAIQGTSAVTTLRLGVLASIPPDWIARFLIAAAPARPAHRVELVEGRERDLAEQLGRGRIDVALTILRADDDRLPRERLFTEGYALAVSTDHPLASRGVIAASELADNPMIVRRSCELLAETSRFFTARGVRPSFLARTHDETRALDYVRAGLGVTVMPDGYRAPGIARPRLADFEFTRDIGLIYAAHADRHGEQPILRILKASIDGFLHAA